MKIKQIYVKTISVGSPIRNAVIDFSTMTISVVAIRTDIIRNGKPIIGYGFNSNGRYAQGGIIIDRILPRLYKAQEKDLLNEEGSNFDPFKCLQVMMKNEKPGGHGERSVAVGTIDMAIWDLVSKIENKPLYKVLADRYNNGEYDHKVYIYAAGGYYYPGKEIHGLQDEFKRYLDMGFNTCKMKVGGESVGIDLKRIEGAMDVVGDGNNLAIDVNGKFDLKMAIDFLKNIESYHLKWYEEAVDPLDYLSNAAVSEVSKTPIATGENIFSLIDTLNLVRYGGLMPDRDYIQVDPVLSYGLAEYINILKMLNKHGWSSRRCIPHGGHQFGIHIAAGLGLYGMEAYPNVFVPFGKFATGMELKNGFVSLIEAPGIGFEEIPDLYPILKSLHTSPNLASNENNIKR
jgi:L-alanine-DL-glutamate epimerase-like enolase superfamily enzyme